MIVFNVDQVQEEMINYNDYKYMVEQLRRIGDGKIGRPVFLDDPD
mgnify:CR=1